MTTPAQYVPSRWQQKVNIVPVDNSAALAAERRNLDNQTYHVNAWNSQIKTLQAQIKKAKGSTKTRLQNNLKNAQKGLSAANTRKASAQNKVWELSGQYDKLLSGANRDAYAAISSLFSSFGLGSLAGKIYGYVKNGYSPDTISISLQDTPEYKERFAGNELRQQRGLPVLSPAEYLSVEASYRQIAESAGLPQGFYDNPADFRELIGKNVSPTEWQSRVDLASQAVALSPPEFRNALKAMGIPETQLTAYFLDENRALPELQKSAATAAVGAEALQRGLTFDKAYSENLALQGIGAEEASQGYSTIRNELDALRALGQIYGSNWAQRQSEQVVFEGEAGATQLRTRLLAQEAGSFGGATGAARGGLSQAGGAR